jgi:hypothetical protein
VFAFDGKQLSDFVFLVKNRDDWMPLPLSDDVRKLCSKFSAPADRPLPVDPVDGYYYFRDIQMSKPERYDTQKPAWGRPSFNFILGILDTKEKKLYITRQDT